MYCCKEPKYAHYFRYFLLCFFTFLRESEYYQDECAKKQNCNEWSRFQLNVERYHLSELVVFIVKLLNIALNTGLGYIIALLLIRYFFGRILYFRLFLLRFLGWFFFVFFEQITELLLEIFHSDKSFFYILVFQISFLLSCICFG